VLTTNVRDKEFMKDRAYYKGTYYRCPPVGRRIEQGYGHEPVEPAQKIEILKRLCSQRAYQAGKIETGCLTAATKPTPHADIAYMTGFGSPSYSTAI
jgi:hypothetical protein